MRSTSSKSCRPKSGIVQYFGRPRHLFQLSVFAVTLGIGVRFYIYVHQALAAGPITVRRPPGVEGFLPIGALMGWKQFLQTGRWDVVHPAAMVIFGWAVLVSFAFRKSFCGWFCPIGTISEWCGQAGRRLFGRNFLLPARIDIPLRSLKYILLAFFLWAVSTMSIRQTAAFMDSPYFKLSDVKMLFFFTRISMLAAGILSLLVILSLLFRNFWCRYLCPYGALLGLWAIISPSRIRRSEKACIRCGRCDRACPSHLPVSKKPAINSPDCTGCLACVEACPEKEALTLSVMGVHRRVLTPRRLGICMALLFLAAVTIASVSGHWQGNVSDREFVARLSTVDSLEHPAFH